jgi:DNA invertase Pin-like site-specific DNA recombinase
MKSKAYSYIRFSAPDQIKGDSLRRQKERSEEYAKKHDLQLDTSLKLEDLGISAFKGKNAIEGALSGFLKAVQTGKVRKGSYLLIESLDRFSRDKMSMALSRFIEIINLGITIVTLIDEQIYNKESIDNKTENLFTAIVVLMRSHEESATKSERVRRAWNEKRKKAILEGKPLTKICPSWLYLEKDEYKPIKERALIIKRIFKLSMSGMGKRSIAKFLNSEKIDTWGNGINKSRKANGWHDSYIQKIIRNDAVIGRYHVHTIDPVTGKRVATGEVIENYFPKIISELDWNRLQLKAKIPSGQKGKNNIISNLFTGIVYDGYTGAKMRFVNKGGKRGCGKYLSSDISRIDPKTKSQNWTYHHFESAILTYLLSLNWTILAKANTSNTNDLLEKKAEVENSIKLRKDRMASLLVDFSNTGVETSEIFKEAIIKIKNEIDSLESEYNKVSIGIQDNIDTSDFISEGLSEFKKLCFSQKYEDRIKLQTEVRRRIYKISVFKNGNIPDELSSRVHLYDKKDSYILIELRHSRKLTLLRFDHIKPIKSNMIRENFPSKLIKFCVKNIISFKTSAKNAENTVKICDLYKKT